MGARLTQNWALLTSVFYSTPRSYNGYFVDLFVRASNSVAIGMYRKFGYSVYRRVVGYYSGAMDEDAFGESRFSSLEGYFFFGDEG